MSNTQAINPGSGGGGGAGVNTINGVTPVGNNITFIDQLNVGAITITAPGSAGAGSIGLGVNVDGTTISISGTAPTDVLTQTNTVVVTTTTTNIAPFSASIYSVSIPDDTVFYFEADFIGTTAAHTVIAGGKCQAVVSKIAGAVLIVDIQNQWLATAPASPPSGQNDANFVAAGANLDFVVFGSATAAMNWKARINFVSIA